MIVLPALHEYTCACLHMLIQYVSQPSREYTRIVMKIANSAGKGHVCQVSKIGHGNRVTCSKITLEMRLVEARHRSCKKRRQNLAIYDRCLLYHKEKSYE